jgi:hypothetical protein
MSKTPRDHEKELTAVWDAFAEMIAKSSDEEILAQAREEGRDPRETATHVRSLLRNALRSYQQTKLRAAEERYKQRIAEIFQASHALPQNPEIRRRLLLNVLTKMPEMRPALLTAQHRELSGYTDADIASLLKQLADLGVLDDITKIDEDKQ